MPQAPPPLPSPLTSFALIGVVVSLAAGAFGYTAGWLSPDRLTPTKLVAGLAPPSGPALGYRRNHAKGICFTGVFEANGKGSEISRASVLASGRHAVLGRFNLATPSPDAPDATVRVRGLGLQVTGSDGAVWRSAMIDPPFFPVATPEDFYALLMAGRDKAPDAMARFAAAHPEFSAFVAWAKSAPWTASYAEEPYNSLNSFLFVDARGQERAVRWSLRPQAQRVPISPADLAKLGPDHLAREIAERIAAAPQRWTMVVTIAEPGDPTADPTKVWPDGRRTIEVGTLIADKVEPERDGPCRDINFDPTILPDGMRVSDDPFPAARSAAYARSYNLRTSEVRYYPYRQDAATGGKR